MPKVFVEFAGLVIALVPSSKKSVSVVLPDARAVGGPEHAAVLLVKDVLGLKGAPDFAVTKPSDSASLTPEYAGWFLRGDVEFSGAFDAFAAPDLRQTMDVKYISNAKTLVAAKLRPTTAKVVLNAGQLSSSGVPFLFDFHYIEDGEEKRVYGPMKEVTLTDRMTWNLGDLESPLKISFTARDGTNTVVTVPQTVGESIIISNLAGGSVKSNSHFDVFYTFSADGTRMPRIQRYKKKGEFAADIPENPDECRAAVFEE